MAVTVGEYLSADLLNNLDASGDITVAGAVVLDTYAVGSSLAIAPLVSASGTDTLITSVSATFQYPYAYEIEYYFRAQINGGTSPFCVRPKLWRSSTSGTLIFDPGGTAVVTTNFASISGKTYVMRTAVSSATTQTIALSGQFTSSGSPTSMDIEASSTGLTRLVVRKVGLASSYSAVATEIPTS